MIDYQYVSLWRRKAVLHERNARRKANALRKRKCVHMALVGALMGIGILGCSINWDCLYTETATVVDTTETEIVVEIGDNLYAYNGNGHNVGDSVTLLMSNNGTEYNKRDDIIIAER